jgi:hypothetical protein
LAGLGASERNSVDFPPSQVLRILDRSFSEERSSSCYLAVQFTIGFRLESLPEPNGLGQTREDRVSRGSECLVNDREDAELKAVDKAIGSLRAQLGL